MTVQQSQGPTRERQSSGAAPGESQANSFPKTFDEGSVFTRAEMQKTQLLELPADLRTRLMGDAGAQQIAAASAEVTSYQGNTALLDARELDRALQHERSLRPPESAQQPLVGIDPTATMYDGGALRAHALKLAQELAQAPARDATPATPEEHTIESPTVTPQPTASVRSLALGKLGSAWRQASLVRRVTALLLPVAALATLWPEDHTPAHAAAPAAPAAKPARTPEPAGNGSAVLAPPPQAEAPNVASEASSSPTTEATPAQRMLEAQALKAAFSGDTVAAARHYERLARERQDPRFELALRLIRTEAMRRP